MPRRQFVPLAIDAEPREPLTGPSWSTTFPHSQVLRAKTILASARILSNTEACRRVGTSSQAVGKWRRRFFERGVHGLHDELILGWPRARTPTSGVTRLINRALRERP